VTRTVYCMNIRTESFLEQFQTVHVLVLEFSIFSVQSNKESY